MKNNFTHSLIKYPLLFLLLILLSFNNLWSQSITEAANGNNISIMNTTVAPGSGTWTTLSTITVSETAIGQIQTGTYTVSLPVGWQFDTSQNVLIATSAGNIAFANAAVTPSSTSFQFTVITASTVASTFNFTLIKVRPTISTTSGVSSMSVSGAAPLNGREFAQLSTVSGPLNAYRISGSGAATAGSAHATTINMVDLFGNTVTAFNGDKNLTFIGLSAGLNGLNPTITNKSAVATSFNTSIPITFTNGIMTAGGSILPYKAETKIISCSDGTYTSSGAGGTNYSLVVSTASHTLFTFSNIPGTTHKASFSVTITATDAFLNPILTYTGTPTITATGTAGSTISPVNPQVAAAFTAGVSVPAVNITLLGAGTLKSLTATDGAATGTSNIFTISPADLTIIPDAGQTKVFSIADPVYTYTCSPALLGGETFTGTLGRVAGENTGTYAYKINTLASANYTLKMTITPNTFSITPLPVVITPAANSKVIGTSDPIPVTTYSPVPNPVSTGGTLTTGTALGRVAGELLGNYNYTLGSLSYGPNYSLSLGGANQFSIIAPAPTANTATSVTPVSFYANWSACTGATGYYLDVSTSNTFASFVAGYENLDIGNKTTYAVTGLTANTFYYYRVRAYYSSVTSVNSNMKTVYTLLRYPTATAATNITKTSFSANWLALVELDGNIETGAGAESQKTVNVKSVAMIANVYSLDVATDPGFTNMLPGYNNKNIGDVLTCNITGLNIGTAYYYRMRVSSPTGISVYSNVITVFTSAEIPVLAKMETGMLNYTVKYSDLVLTDSTIIQYAGAASVQKATIIISGNYIKNEDQLVISNPDGLTTSWDNENGKLVIAGSSSPLNYQMLLRAVKYRNISLTPTALTKDITFTINNTDFASNSVTRSIKVNSANLAPTVKNLEKNTLTYLKGITGLRMSLSDSLVVEDTDNYYLNGATVKFTQGYIRDEDFLDFNNTTFLTGSFSTVTGILTITGKETIANYQAFLRNLCYRNSNTNNALTSQKVLQFDVNDGLVNSTPVFRLLVVKSSVETPTELNGIIASNKVQLTWKDNSSSEQGYIVERSEGTNTLYSEITRLSANAISYSDQNIVNGRKYYYRVTAYNGTAKSDYSNEISVTGIVVGIADLNGLPKDYVVNQNYPNPFNPSTVITYGLPYEANVKIEIFNSIGQLVDVLTNGTKSAGYYKVRWNAGNMASGIYLYKITATGVTGGNQFTQIKSMILLK